MDDNGIVINVGSDTNSYAAKNLNIAFDTKVANLQYEQATINAQNAAETATTATAAANNAATSANTAADAANTAAALANQKAAVAQTATDAAITVTANANAATDAAETATQNATTAATAATAAATDATAATTNANTAANNAAAAETIRVNAETTRAAAETERVSNENSRVLNENGRISNELTRESSEGERINSENGRVTAENNRDNDETSRVNAEAARDSSETTRISNENTRISNEQARVTAEAGRQAALDGKLDKASVKQAIGTSTTDVMSQKAVTDELAKKQDTNLLASYTHTGNKEVYISSIDYTTNTFTSVGHGLINSTTYYNTLMLVINRNETIYPYNVMPFNSADLTPNGFFVINTTSDTFQLSTTAGGAAITLVNKAENDLTKWHFEYTTVKTITILGLLGKINAGVKTVIDGTIIWGYAQYMGAAVAAGMTYIKSSDGATPSFNYPVIYGRNDYPVPCFGGQIIHTDIYTANGHRKIFDIAVYGYGTTLNKVAMTNKYINFVTPIAVADSSKSFVKLDGVSISNGTTIKVYSL